jgi:hypothetical protein
MVNGDVFEKMQAHILDQKAIKMNDAEQLSK